MRRTITGVATLGLAGVLAAVVLAGTVSGTPKNDTLRGTAKADNINGKAGNDKLYGLAGNDKLTGGLGNDLLNGGPGADNLNCGAGSDAAQADDSDQVSPTCEKVTGITPPAVSIADATVVEGNAGATLAFQVTLSKASKKAASVQYATANGSASSPADYASATGNLTFAAGEKSKTIAVSIVGELNYEPDETFTVMLSSPVNATVADASATGTITNDDPIAAPGHYSGRTSQNETVDFDVLSGGNALTSLRTGQINQSCIPGGTISGGRVDLGTTPYPIRADGSFSIDLTYPGTVSGGGQVAPTTTHLVITGQIANGAASGTLLKTISFTLLGTNYACTSNAQTWNAART
jgi:hypothetical protein